VNKGQRKVSKTNPPEFLLPENAVHSVFLNYSSQSKRDAWEEKKDAQEFYTDVVDEAELSVKQWEFGFISFVPNEINALGLIKKNSRVATKKVRIIIVNSINLVRPLLRSDLAGKISSKYLEEWNSAWSQPNFSQFRREI